MDFSQYYSYQSNKIIFSITFNQSIDNILWPSDLIAIQFGPNFNQSIDKVVWPESLKEIYFGWNFNQSLHNLPLSLEILIIPNLKKPLSNLPFNLKEIIFLQTKEDIIEQCKLPFKCISTVLKS